MKDVTVERPSQILISLINEVKEMSEISMERLMEILGRRSFGIAIFILAIPNILFISVIPGLSVLFGIPMLLISIEMCLGLKTPWLPKRLLNKTIPSEKLISFITASLPYIQKSEKFLKPRFLFISSKSGERFVGLLFILLSITLMLPIPFSNMILGLLISITALGIVTKDGVAICFGLLLSIIFFIVIFMTTNVLINGFLS